VPFGSGLFSRQLHNLKDDPLELEDLAASMPQKVAQLKTLWKSESDRLEEQAAKH
jgi:hypothetical protein